MKAVLGGVLASLLVAGQPALAGEYAADGSVVGECLMAAARLYQLPPDLLVILLNVENGRLGKVSQNTNKTVDIGPMQVNDTWIGKLAEHWRASPEATYVALRDNFCANIEGGAWIMRKGLDEAGGDIWEGVALYHSHTPKYKQEYLQQVQAHVLRLRRQAEMEIAEASAADGR